MLNVVAPLPIASRSIRHARQKYQDLVRTMATDQALYLASYCRRMAAGGSQSWDGVEHAISSLARNPAQYLAYAAYWQSIADARAAIVQAR